MGEPKIEKEHGAHKHDPGALAYSRIQQVVLITMVGFYWIITRPLRGSETKQKPPQDKK